jgi:hypothetical protein
MAEAIERADARGTLALRRVGDSREEGLQPSLLVTGRQRDVVTEHRGLSSGVASGKSAGSRYAYGWVETSTPLSSRFPLLNLLLISVLLLLHLEFICCHICS